MPADKNVSLLKNDFNLNFTNVIFCLEAGLEKFMFYLLAITILVSRLRLM
jgi:hypothetical protein